VSVEVDLNLHRKPGLQFHVNQAESAVHEVEVQEQAFPAGRLHERATFLKLEGEGPAGFHDRKDADQPALDAVILGYLPGQLFLAGGNTQVLERPAGLRGQRFGVLMDFAGVVGEEVLQTAEPDLLLIEELSHGPTGLNRQVTAKEHAIEAAQCPMDLVLMFAYK